MPVALVMGAVVRQTFQTKGLAAGVAEFKAARDGTEVTLAVADRDAKDGKGLVKSWNDRTANDFKTSNVVVIPVTD